MRISDWSSDVCSSDLDSTLQLQPANAIVKAAEKEGIAVSDIDLFELNEAFAAVGIESARQLGVEADKVNVNGGVIAIGHPVGMTGARIVLHPALELQSRGGGNGDVATCGGGVPRSEEQKYELETTKRTSFRD